MEPKYHHHMIVAEIVFMPKADSVVNSLRVNGVLVDPEKDIPIRLLGKAQQIVQLQFHNRMEGQDIQVLDVVLMNFMYLGHMTEAEFQKVPEGVALKEKTPKPALSVVPDLDTAVAEASKKPK